MAPIPANLDTPTLLEPPAALQKTQGRQEPGNKADVAKSPRCDAPKQAQLPPNLPKKRGVVAYAHAHQAPKGAGRPGASHFNLRKPKCAGRPKVVHFSVRPEERAVMDRSSLMGYENVFVNEPLSPSTAHLAADADVVTTFVHDRVKAEVFDVLPRLRAVAQRATGYDNVDLGAAKAHGVSVFNVPEYGSRTVAEFAFTLLLAVTRRLEKAHHRIEQGDFRIEGLMGHDLHGKRMVIVGGGKIGMCAAEIAKGFGMDVVVVDPDENPGAAARIGFRYEPLETALIHADVISLHVPLIPGKTEHLISAESLSRVKPGAILINTARGGVVDSAALLQALDHGRIRGAGLDTFEGESLLIDTTDQVSRAPLVDELRKRENVILTPHVAFSSEEALERIMEATAKNIQSSVWGGVENRVAKVPHGQARATACLHDLSAQIEGWALDHGLAGEGLKALGHHLSMAFAALEAGDDARRAQALERLAGSCQALGAGQSLIELIHQSQI